MANLKLSIALAIAFGQLAATSRAQTPLARTALQKASPGAAVTAPEANPSTTEATVPAAPSASTPAVGAAASPATSLAPSSVIAGLESSKLQPPTIVTQPESLAQSLPPVVVNQAQPPEVTVTPRTYDHRFSATLDVASVLWRSGRGYELFSTNDAAWRIAIGVGYDFLKLPSQVILSLEAGAMLEPSHSPDASSGLLGNTLSGTLAASTILLGGTLRWAATPWFVPYARLALFTSRIAVDIQTATTYTTSGSSGADWSYHRWAEGGSLGGGVMFNLPPRTPVNVGVLLEGGYWLQQSIDILLERSLPPGSISTSGAPVGSLENSGPYFRLAGMLRF